MMTRLLGIAQRIDALNQYVGTLSGWLILCTILISFGNALFRYGFDLSSNAWLEIQWLLFSAVFLLGAGYAHLHDQHVRIDVISNRLTPRLRACIDIFGTLFFLLPMAGLVIYLSWPIFLRAWVSGEASSNAGGLVVWPARLLVPAGLLLLSLQGVSECIKRLAFLTGHVRNPDEAIK